MRPKININFNLNVPVDNLRQFVDALRSLTKQEVAVGVPEEKADRKSGDPANNAMIAYVQNYGFPALNIPARPFMEPGIRNAQDQITSELEAAALDALDGKLPTRRFHRAGLVAQDSIKAKIRSNIPPKLAKRTLAARRRRGVTRTDTLRDSGQLLNSIKYVIIDREKLSANPMNQLHMDESKVREAVEKTQR